jgi:hypothetical protein
MVVEGIFLMSVENSLPKLLAEVKYLIKSMA